MARETPTRQWVRDIAVELLNQGQKPTQIAIKRKIFELHGVTASPNVVMDELNKFLVEVGQADVRRFKLPNLPPELSEAVTTIWELACDRSNDLAASKLAELAVKEKDIESSIQSVERLLAEEKITTLTLRNELALAHQSLEQKTQSCIDTRNELVEVKAKLESLMERNAELVAEKIRSEALYEQRVIAVENNARLELERVRTEHDKVVEKLTVAHQSEAQTWDGLRKHLLNQTDQLRQAAKMTEEKQKDVIADLELRTGALTRKANDATQEVSRLSGMVEVLQAQTVKLNVLEKECQQLKVEMGQKHGAIRDWVRSVVPEVFGAFEERFAKIQEI